MIAVGTVLHDTYRIDAELGRGGMGCVFSATHMRLPRRVAVKVLTQIADAHALKRFRREAEICSQIGHGNIVEVYDFNELDGQPYIVMELLTGESLRQRLEREPVLPRPLLVQMVREIGKALAATHAVGVIHRDLKPENLFLCREDGVERFKILDFGISKIMGAMSLQTREDSLLGTPGYMSPEQARGDVQHVTASADQFSFATIVYEALSGHPAFMAPEDTPYTVLYKIVNREPAPLLNEPPAVRAVLARAMAKEPSARFADVAELAGALVGVLEPAALPAARRSRRAAWVALALGATTLGAGVIARQVLHARPPANATPPTVTPAPIAPLPTVRPPSPPPPISLQPILPSTTSPSTSAPAPADMSRAQDAGLPARPIKRRTPSAHHPTTPTKPAASDDELSNPYDEPKP